MTPVAQSRSEQWYIRGEAGSFGPLPLAQILHYIILKRLRESDEVSRDGITWTPLPEVGALNLKTALALDQVVTEAERQRLERTQSWLLDHPEAVGIHNNEIDTVAEAKSQRLRTLLSYSAVVLLSILIVASAIILTRMEIRPPDPECEASPMAGVNWSNCSKIGAQLVGLDLSQALLRGARFQESDLTGTDFSGSDLAYADFAKASLEGAQFKGSNLMGVDFSNANLRGANFENADLSYANLQGAVLKGVNLKGAKLAKTKWMNGVECRRDSIGGCAVNRN